jgi:preprotein translocase subunit SecF
MRMTLDDSLLTVAIIAVIVIVSAALTIVSPIFGALFIGWLIGVWSSAFASKYRTASQLWTLWEKPDESARAPKPDTDWFPATPRDEGDDEGP